VARGVDELHFHLVRCVELDHCAEVVFPQSVTWKVLVKDDHLEEPYFMGDLRDRR